MQQKQFSTALFLRVDLLRDCNAVLSEVEGISYVVVNIRETGSNLLSDFIFFT